MVRLHRFTASPSDGYAAHAMSTILVTDHPWPDLTIERSILEAAGHRVIAGPEATPDAAYVEAMTAEHDPIAIMTCWARVSATAIARPSELRIVARMGVGLDNIDLPAASARGAWVTNVPDYCVEEVSDHALALLLDLWRGVTAMDRDVKAGNWNPGAARGRRILDMTVGIIGFGRIGQSTAMKLANGFGCRVLVTSPTLLRLNHPGATLAERVEVADLATMQREADAIVINAPLTPDSRHTLDDAFFGALTRKPLIVNVSRGGWIDNDALVRALDGELVSGAGLDVVEGEPTPPRRLVDRIDVIVTPHIAFASDASLAELRHRSAENVVRALRGDKPLNICNAPERASN
jgi:D-3-phosphoglycerate dehydrogenase